MFKNKIYSFKKTHQCKLKFVLSSCHLPGSKECFQQNPRHAVVFNYLASYLQSFIFQSTLNLNSHMLSEVLLLLDCHHCPLAYLPSFGNSVIGLNNNSIKS